MSEKVEKKIRAVAIYLPQFHPFRENDRWWGKGFTEWTNVTKAQSYFKQHYQPQLPGELGFYDLRVPEVRQQQAELAKAYSISGFCYYHYWFHGKRLLERPFDSVIQSGKPDFPFMLFWANESWDRRWLGEGQDALIKQEYSPDDDYRHSKYLVDVFQDKRYIKVNGRPIFIIYRPKDLPDISATISTLRGVCAKSHINPYLVASNSRLSKAEEHEMRAKGFDKILNFRPQLGVLPDIFNNKFLWKRLLRNTISAGVFSGKMKIYDYRKAVESMKSLEDQDYRDCIPSAFVGWDNTPRSGKKGSIIIGNKAEFFEKELRRIASKLAASDTDCDLVFINAWNEWAEGNHLEPCSKFGDAYLCAVRNVFGNNK